MRWVALARSAGSVTARFAKEKGPPLFATADRSVPVEIREYSVAMSTLPLSIPGGGLSTTSTPVGSAAITCFKVPLDAKTWTCTGLELPLFIDTLMIFQRCTHRGLTGATIAIYPERLEPYRKGSVTERHRAAASRASRGAGIGGSDADARAARHETPESRA